MTTSIRINDSLYHAAQKEAKIEHRTISGQVEFWAKVGRASLDNPDLPVEFIKDLLLAKAEATEDLTVFKPHSQTP